MKILTNRNGIALVAVLTVLLVLTLLLPAMFTMSERATKDALRGQDEQRASYLARTMIEMSVAAFQNIYDAAEEEQDSGTIDTSAATTYTYRLNQFYSTKTMTAQKLYMYRNDSDTGVKFPKEPERRKYETDEAYNSAINEWKNKLYEYEKTGVIYSTTAPDANKKAILPIKSADGKQTNNCECTCVGEATCTITYDNGIEYYETVYNQTTKSYTTRKITEEEYDTGIETYGSSQSTTAPQYSKLEKLNVVFASHAIVNGKGGSRGCTLVLPTKPAEKQWIVPANVESNQIFVDSTKATTQKRLNIPDSYFVDPDAVKDQKMYIFSCIGNMVLSKEGMTINGEDYADYVNANNYENQYADFSLGVHPITTTVNPENDPGFNCVKTNNMRSWSTEGQKDNFVGFTATNGIQVDMPVNLLINPCRTRRIGDGLDRNQSLYKIMYYQAPTIVFNEEVNSFISLYQKTSLFDQLLDYNAFRMSSIILAAPQSTPYSYYHSTYKKTVKAGMVYFMEDAYVWLVPLTEDGSNWKTQSVYYKGSDIILYKFANAGDVYLFNNEVETTVKDANGTVSTHKAGFSMTNYFMDVIYSDGMAKENLSWWQFWSWIQEGIYGAVSNTVRDKNYVEEDLKYVGNIKTGGLNSTPVIDDFYVIWDS